MFLFLFVARAESELVDQAFTCAVSFLLRSGAVMLLFRGDFGCLMYTGDFRWEMSSERANKGRIALLNALEDNTVDILYLDNTYCNPSYAFPSREIAARQVKNSS